MKPINYFSKYGKIYGVSHGQNNTPLRPYSLEVFTKYDEAISWLLTESGSFEVRELMSKSKAEKYVGKILQNDGE